MPAAKKKSSTKQSSAENKTQEVANRDTSRAQESQPERQSQFATILIGLLIIASGLLIYNYFQSVNQPNTTTSEQANNQEESSPTPTPSGEDNGEQPKAAENSYTVKGGDSLWSVAEEVYGDGHQWRKIAEANELATDAQGRPVIEVGQLLAVPETTGSDSTEDQLAQAPEPTATPEVAGESTGNGQLSETPSTAIETHTVQRGETLWSIADQAYGDGQEWHLIFNDSHNNLGTLADGTPLIHAGNVLYIPNAP